MGIKSAALIGAGAIGSYFVTGLTKSLGDDFVLIAEGERKRRLEDQGVTINGRCYRPRVLTPEEARGIDLIVVAVKYGALPAAISMVERAVTDGTIVLCPMNGVDCEVRIDEKIGAGRTVLSMIKIQAYREDGELKFDPALTLGVYFGEPGGVSSPRTDALCELFEKSGIRYHLCEDIVKTMWLKYALNISKNLPQAILNCGYGAYSASDNVMYISEKMRAEVAAVAAAKGIDISDRADASGNNTQLPADSRFSTLQDLDAKRPTEIDMFSGALMRMGKELGVETPFNDFAYHAIKALEEKNKGVFS